MSRKIAAILFAGLLGLSGVACDASVEADGEGDGVQLDGDINVDDNDDGNEGE